MTHERRDRWDMRHREAGPGTPEPSLLEMIPLLPRGLVLDVAAGAGRHAIALARAGFRVVAADYAETAMRLTGAVAAAEHLPIFPVVADFEDGFPFQRGVFDAVVNINFLNRDLLPMLKGALRAGGMLFFDTFLLDQAAIGHPRDPRFLLRHYELREMLSDMELIRYREGLTVYSAGKQAWRATALARRV
jgi:tellurite methyltransferase